MGGSDVAHAAAAADGCGGAGAARIGGRRAGSSNCPSRRSRAWRWTIYGRRRRSRASSIALRRRRGSARRTSWRCSRRAGRISRRCAGAADRLRAARVGDTVTYVVNRNINYTNICTYGCKFCAFSKGRHNLGHRDAPYDLDLEEIAHRTAEAWARGATEVCLQGGIKPGYTGHTYLAIVEAVKWAAPDMHVHAFSPLEVRTGADTLKLSLFDYLSRLREAGLGEPAGHGGRDPRRRGARGALPGQDQHGGVARGDGDGACRGPAQHRHHHVRPRRRLPALGAPPPARARAAGADRRLHRVRAAAVRAHGGADLPQGRSRARARPSARRC